MKSRLDWEEGGRRCLGQLPVLRKEMVKYPIFGDLTRINEPWYFASLKQGSKSAEPQVTSTSLCRESKKRVVPELSWGSNAFARSILVRCSRTWQWSGAYHEFNPTVRKNLSSI